MKAELLAPAGSYDSMIAAFAAGADAVYIGGSRFGARAFADNLDEEQMLCAIDYAHLRGKKLYLTVNTLVKNEEMDGLYEYLKPFYQNGLDAVIVQDLGAMQFIKHEFPGMDIHASTQMTVTGEYGASFLKELGVSRVVTARELSFAEIKKIYDKTGMEIESFVHGALCFCYSGQCLFSSMIGGRSGNRGRCAQPCRLAYQLTDKDKIINSERQPYLLSPKDMCTLSILPKILESGVYSLKIEGRMKRPEYTAGVVRIYRKYLDLLEQKGKKNYQVAKADMEELMDLYNRGGFTEGYYGQHNGPDMMSMERPNHWGTKAARILSIGKGGCRIQALEDLHTKDVLEYRNGDLVTDITLNQSVARGKETTVSVPKTMRISGKNPIFYRTRNESLLLELEKKFLQEKVSEKINGEFILKKEEPAILNIHANGHSVTVSGACPQAAQNRPITSIEVEKQLKKTGGTAFRFEELHIEMEDGLFLPMQALNELRRAGIAALEEDILNSYYRKEDAKKEGAKTEGVETEDQTETCEKRDVLSNPSMSMSVSLRTREQYQAVLETDAIKRIYLDSGFFKNRTEFLNHTAELIAECHGNKKECFYTMPWIFREKAKKYYSGAESIAVLKQFDGIMIKSLEEYEFLKEAGYEGELISDYNLYSWNQESIELYASMGLSGDTVPLELNDKEIRMRGCHNSEMVVYGYLPVMVSAQCQVKNHLGCQQKEQILFLKDRKKKKFPVTNQCSFCYNIIYNSTPLELLQNSSEILAMEPGSIRLQFTMEKKAEVREILDAYTETFLHRNHIVRNPKEFTRGHFKRGVE